MGSSRTRVVAVCACSVFLFRVCSGFVPFFCVPGVFRFCPVFLFRVCSVFAVGMFRFCSVCSSSRKLMDRNRIGCWKRPLTSSRVKLYLRLGRRLGGAAARPFALLARNPASNDRSFLDTVCLEPRVSVSLLFGRGVVETRVRRAARRSSHLPNSRHSLCPLCQNFQRTEYSFSSDAGGCAPRRRRRGAPRFTRSPSEDRPRFFVLFGTFFFLLLTEPISWGRFLCINRVAFQSVSRVSALCVLRMVSGERRRVGVPRCALAATAGL